MTNIWDSTINLDIDTIASLLLKQFGIQVTTCTLLGEGYDNYAYLINSNLVFRFPRRNFGLMCITNEILILPYLAQHLQFAFSYPEYIGQASSEFPYPFAGYNYLAGKSLTHYQSPLINDPQFAIKLAQWLKALHAIPVLEEHLNNIEGDQQWRLDINNRIETIIPHLEQYQRQYDYAGFSIEKLKEIVGNFAKLKFNIANVSYVHGDLYSRHILVDNHGMPASLIDWGDVHINHPGIDLSVGVMIFTEEVRDVFFKNYGLFDNETLQIAMFRAFCHSVMALPYSVETGDALFQGWTKAALENTIVYFS